MARDYNIRGEGFYSLFGFGARKSRYRNWITFSKGDFHGIWVNVRNDAQLRRLPNGRYRYFRYGDWGSSDYGSFRYLADKYNF